jgi:hypothetical protein
MSSKYKCIRAEESLVRGWVHQFKIGGIYNEVSLPEEMDCTGMLKLEGEDGLNWYVDEDQFEKIDSEQSSKKGSSIRRWFSKF